MENKLYKDKGPDDYESMCNVCNSFRTAIYDDVQSLLLKFVQHIEGVLNNTDRYKYDSQLYPLDCANFAGFKDPLYEETNKCKEASSIKGCTFSPPLSTQECSYVLTSSIDSNFMPFRPSSDPTNITMQRNSASFYPSTGTNPRPTIKSNSPKPQMLRHLRTDPSLISSISEPLQDGVGEFNDCEAAIGDDPLTCDIAAWRKGVGFIKDSSTGRVTTPIATAPPTRGIMGCDHCTTCKHTDVPSSSFRAILDTDSSPVDDGDDSAIMFTHANQPMTTYQHHCHFNPVSATIEPVRFTIGSNMDECGPSSAASPKSFRPLNSRANWPSNIIVANSSTSCGSYIPGAWSRQGSKAGSLTDVSAVASNAPHQQSSVPSAVCSNEFRHQVQAPSHSTSSPARSSKMSAMSSTAVNSRSSSSSGASNTVTVVEIHSTTVDRRKTQIIDMAAVAESIRRVEPSAPSGSSHNTSKMPPETYITNYIDETCSNASANTSMYIPSPAIDRNDIQRRASASNIDETDTTRRRLEARLSFREFRSRPPTPEMLTQTESDEVKIPGDVLRRAWLTASTQSRSPRIHAIFATALAKSVFNNEELARASSHSNESSSLDPAKVLAIHRTVAKQLHWDRPPRPSRAEINSKIREIDAALENLCTESKRKQARLQSVHK